MTESSTKANRMESIAIACTALGGVLLSGGVLACILYVLLTLTLLIPARPGFSQAAPVAAGVRLQAGIEKEDVDGDLKSAMDIYQKIAADTSAPRDVRAQALLRLAGCDEKLGHQAKQVYEQIVHDYADMPAAAQARNRLASLKQQEHPAAPATMSVRKIETSSLGEMSATETDGERAIYRASDGNLYLGDLAGRSRRLVFRPQQKTLYNWRPSPDFSMVALNFQSRPGDPGFLAVVKSDGTGYREVFHDDAQGTLLTHCCASLDWSWDNRYLVLNVYKPSGSRFFVLSVADGQQRELKLPGSPCLSRAAFSPNGRFIAYETFPGCDSATNGSRRTFVLPAEGGEPHLVYESKQQTSPGKDINLFKDWTADGRYLMIQDLSRDGRSALFLLPMKDGTAAGPAQMVRYGNFRWSWTAASGAFLYQDNSTRPVESDVYGASLDAGGHWGAWQRLDLRGGGFPNGDHSPSFSSDGAELFYLAPGTEPGKTDLVSREVSTGHERVLYQLSGSHINCMHASSSPTVVCANTENDGTTKLVSVAVQSGEAEQLGSFDRPRIILQHSPDDKTIYFDSRTYDGPGTILQWDVAARKETKLVSEQERNEYLFFPSPDGKWLVRIRPESELSVRPLSGGEWKSLVSETNGIGWEDAVSPDSNWVIYHEHDPAGADWLARVSIAGGKPERLGDFPKNCSDGYLSISPDGRQVLATCYRNPSWSADDEVWVLENYLPPVSK